MISDVKHGWDESRGWALGALAGIAEAWRLSLPESGVEIVEGKRPARPAHREETQCATHVVSTVDRTKAPRRWLDAGRRGSCSERSEGRVVARRFVGLIVGVVTATDAVREGLFEVAVLSDVAPQRAHGREERARRRVPGAARLEG